METLAIRLAISCMIRKGAASSSFSFVTCSLYKMCQRFGSSYGDITDLLSKNETAKKTCALFR
jgi:hypothetical protein